MSPTLEPDPRPCPRCCCTTIWTAGCARRPSSSWPRRPATLTCPRTTRTSWPRSSPPGAHRGHLNLYLDAFRHTVGVMQTAEGLRRVARECAEDLAADGIVYAEVRFAPELHTERGLTLDEVVRAVLAGFAEGSENRPITVYALLTAMRTAARSQEIAELAVRHRDSGVVGFDIAGRGGGLAAEPSPGRLPVHPPGELPPHHPRGRGLRAAVDLGGGAVLRHRAAGPRGADRRGHRHLPQRSGDARPPGRLHPRPAHPAGDVPVVQRADRRGHLDRAPTRCGCCASCSSG